MSSGKFIPGEAEWVTSHFHDVPRETVEFCGDIELFIAGGLAILRKIEHVGYNVWAQRPVLDRWEKAALLGGALWRRARRHVAGW